jgi:3-dehydroquinate dehydratase II
MGSGLSGRRGTAERLRVDRTFGFGNDPRQILPSAGSNRNVPMSRIVYVLNGPNLNLLGKRQPAIYGYETLADVEADCRRVGQELDLEIAFHQSNAEYQIIDWIHEARERAGGIIINPAAFTHTSVAILDALNTCEFPIIEVHISNVHKRESFRHHSYVSLVASGVIAGFGTQGYQLALHRHARLISEAKT